MTRTLAVLLVVTAACKQSSGVPDAAPAAPVVTTATATATVTPTPTAPDTVAPLGGTKPLPPGHTVVKLADGGVGVKLPDGGIVTSSTDAGYTLPFAIPTTFPTAITVPSGMPSTFPTALPSGVTIPSGFPQWPPPQPSGH